MISLSSSSETHISRVTESVTVADSANFTWSVELKGYEDSEGQKAKADPSSPFVSGTSSNTHTKKVFSLKKQQKMATLHNTQGPKLPI